MSTKKKVLIGVSIFVVLVIAGAVAAIFLTGGDRKQAEQFVSEISSGDTSTAYNQFADALKQVQDYDTFQSQVTSLALDSSCKLSVSGVEASTSSGNTISGTVKCDSKEYAGSFTYENGKLMAYSIE